MSLQDHFFEFMDVIRRATQQLSEPLKLESIDVRLLHDPVGSQNSRGQFAQAIEEISKSRSYAVTLSTRLLFQCEGAPEGVAPGYPLVLVLDTDISNRMPRSVLLHEFGHVKRDYPTIWQILEKTNSFRIIQELEIQHTLDSGGQPNFFTSTLGNRDPFREYVADELARKYVPQEVEEIAALRMVSLRDGLKSERARSFFLELYAKIISSLNNAPLPGIEPDSVSASIADCIKREDFPDYVRRVVTEMISCGSSPLNPLRDRLDDIVSQSRSAAQDLSHLSNGVESYTPV
jgi:hypothetical protein